jgi:glycosyltransferase involved in cell wall biosynthesis
MKITVVTISYNQAAFLEQALRSVLDQEYPDLEYIVVDPGSTDGSRALIERYRPRLSRIILEPDDGPADGLNRGLAAATGELFCYVNADDRLLPGALARVAAAFTRRPGAAAVYGHGFIEDRRSGASYRVRSTVFGRRLMAYGGFFALQQATFFRTGAVRAVGGFNAGNRTCWDAELLADLLLSGYRLRRINDYLGVFTLHENCLTAGDPRTKGAYHADQARLFAKLMNRPPRPFDRFGRRLAWLARWLGDPAGLIVRLLQIADRDRPQQP